MVLFHATNTYKANMHCHTTVSDGKLAPQQVKDMYKAKGYSIVAFSDHNILVNQSELNDENFLAINSLEVDLTEVILDEQFPKCKCYHLNLFSTDPNRTETPPIMRGMMDYYDTDAINAYIKARVDEGFLVSYNHPHWSMQTYDEYSKLKGCFAMEIFNNGCEVTDGYYGYNPQVYDEMLRASGKEGNLFCLSTDDNHNNPIHAVSDSFGGFVMIESPSLNYGDIMNALKSGNFYSSQGPEIHKIHIEDGKLHVKCSEAKVIVVYTDGRACHLKQGDSLTEAEFTLKGNEKYIRVMCRDKNHRDANSNAYWL